MPERTLRGSVAVAGIETLGLATEETARAYACHYRIPGRTCALLMLESEADYERFEIVEADDAAVVEATPAEAAIASTLEEIGASLGDPKIAFLAWIDRLGSPELKLMFVDEPDWLSLDLDELGLPRPSDHALVVFETPPTGDR